MACLLSIKEMVLIMKIRTHKTKMELEMMEKRMETVVKDLKTLKKKTVSLTLK